MPSSISLISSEGDNKMKKIGKLAIIIAAVACLAATCSGAYAAFYVTGSPTTAESIVLTQTRGFNPTFELTATVTGTSSDGGSGMNNIPVTFYVNANGAGWTIIGTSYTNSTGVATSSYSIQSNGETDQFQAAIGMP